MINTKIAQFENTIDDKIIFDEQILTKSQYYVGEYENERLIQTYANLKLVSRFYNLSYDALWKNFNNNNKFVVSEHNYLKKITTYQYVLYYKKLLTEHIAFLQNENLLYINCNVCISKRKKTTPIPSYQYIGTCDNCGKEDNVSFPLLNTFLLEHNLLLKNDSILTPHIKALIPFYLIEKNHNIKHKISYYNKQIETLKKVQERHNLILNKIKDLPVISNEIVKDIDQNAHDEWIIKKNKLKNECISIQREKDFIKKDIAALKIEKDFLEQHLQPKQVSFNFLKNETYLQARSLAAVKKETEQLTTQKNYLFQESEKKAQIEYNKIIDQANEEAQKIIKTAFNNKAKRRNSFTLKTDSKNDKEEIITDRKSFDQKYTIQHSIYTLLLERISSLTNDENTLIKKKNNINEEIKTLSYNIQLLKEQESQKEKTILSLRTTIDEQKHSLKIITQNIQNKQDIYKIGSTQYHVQQDDKKTGKKPPTFSILLFIPFLILIIYTVINPDTEERKTPFENLKMNKSTPNKNIYSVKALIIGKENYPQSITYINQERRIYTITGNHKFWYTTKVGDSVLVTFKNWYNPQFLNVAPLKKSTLNYKKILYPYLIKYK